MKKVNIAGYVLVLFFATQTIAFAQRDRVSEQLKTYFNEVEQTVDATDNPTIKRDLINNSLNEMMSLLGRIEGMNLPKEDLSDVLLLKSDLSDMKSELSGEDGFETVEDHELDEFVDYVQQSMEQAVNSTITISVGTAILIGLLLLLL